MKLKPCPFCGSHPTEDLNCPNESCGLVIFDGTPEKWNRRPEFEPGGIVERIKKHIKLVEGVLGSGTSKGRPMDIIRNDDWKRYCNSRDSLLSDLAQLEEEK